MNADLSPELQGQVLQAVVTPKPRDEQHRYEFMALITSEGKFHFKDVVVVAVYGSKYHLNFTLPALPNIAVWCGVVWCGAVRCGAVRCGAVRCGVVWCGVV